MGGLSVPCLMVIDIYNSNGTVSIIFGPYLKDLLWKISEIAKNAPTWSVFELEKCWWQKHQNINVTSSV